MKKFIVTLFCLLCFLVIIMIFFEHNKTTADNDNPEVLYKNDRSVDLLIYEDTAYVNASNTPWIKELELTANKTLGSIERTKIKKNFKNFDASKLEVGSYIYSTAERKDILLVLVGKDYVPYYKYVEG